MSELSFRSRDIWRDRVMQFSMGAAIVLNVALFAVVAAQFGRLPDEVPLHFDGPGQVDRFGSPAGLYVLPLIGLITWLTAALLGWFFHQVRDEKPVAYIVWGTTVAIQLATWLAIINLLP
jgi:uncharacterized membrane protein